MTAVASVQNSKQAKTRAVEAFVKGTQWNAPESLPWLPCSLALEVPVVDFTLRYLLQLQPGDLIYTSTHQSSDIPLHVNGVLMAWTEFEVVGERLAARITDLI